MPGEAEEAGEAGVLVPLPPHVTKTPQHNPSRHQPERGPRTQSGYSRGKGDRCSPQGPGWLGRTSCFPSLTSDSSKYTQRVILCRIMLLAYSSCLHSKELRSLRSSPESRPCCSRSTARPRQPPQPSSGCGLRSEERRGLGSHGRETWGQGCLAFSEEKTSCYMQDHHVQLNRVCIAQGHHI